MATVTTTSTRTDVLLRPRPLEQCSGCILLLPLLPPKPQLKPIPVEVWERILTFVICEDVGKSRGKEGRGRESKIKPAMALSRTDILLICKNFKAIALPLLYSHVCINSLSSLKKFTDHLYASDQKWDSLHRIPYSTPGRWVHTLDVSGLTPNSRSEFCTIDALLTRLYPLLPLLTRHIMNPSFRMSSRALTSLSTRDESMRLTALKGIKGNVSDGSFLMLEVDPLVRMLRSCENLTELEIIGPGIDELDDLQLSPEAELLFPTYFTPLNLPYLHTLNLLSTHSSPLLFALLHSPLPSLRNLTVTPYHDIPYPASLISRFIETHGACLRSLFFYTPKEWPTILHTSPPNLLELSPDLRHLSLESPLPNIGFPNARTLATETHPLWILSIPRPNGHFLTALERSLKYLPELAVVRIRDVRWLRQGISSRAQVAGVQGEMRDWRRRLMRRNVRLVDADWTEPGDT